MRVRPQLPQCLATSLGLRMPTFRREPDPDAASPAERIRQMEEYLQITAYYEGELTEERVSWLRKKVVVQDRWDSIPESQWGPHRRTRTETAVAQAKRMVDPNLYGELQDIEWVIKRLTEEIDRMEREGKRASRIYTMITGN